MKSALLIADVSNLYYCVKKNLGERCRLDYEKFLGAFNGVVNVKRAIAYGADMDDAASKFRSALNHIGFETKYKEPKVYPSHHPGREVRKADWDVGMAMDVVEFAKDFDVIILGTADGDLVPCVDYIRRMYPNKEVWVYACGISRDLKETCHYWQEIEEKSVIR